MKASEVKELLTVDDIIDLLYELDANPSKKGNEVYCRTICHNGNKQKLVYFSDSKTFSCFTGNCGHGMDIFALIGKIYNIEFPEAFRYICGKFNITMDGEYTLSDQVDTSFIKKFKIKESKYILEEISKTFLNTYYRLFHKSWVEDGISLKTMKKFNILFSIAENKIIIPHFDIDGRLLGVRGRALNKDEIDSGKKYMPVYHKQGGVLKYPTGGNLFGININKEKIKEVKSVVLVESEKGVLQLDSMDFHIPGLGVSGSNLTDEQVKILVSLEIENVIIALDKEYQEVGTNEELFYKKKIKSGFIDKLLPHFKVGIIWDRDDLVDFKNSPTDHGKAVFEVLFAERIII